ncbi:Big1p KNAG_0B04330 [Huiozyma naganishii CBS 8797]|uniref:Protein BIG1 n=1 Tax=Huiozyma naganishii (strain ATCC MYA-139 / BCRC 22969 / CBS 8797 / KCTC 17520 / NBRC 10181 / NCYC 3082 / Yp74L-3) TaxID=1071383 RepID=J7RVC7_HUIN7|nr:hypothetical protein KNAG_0B04330 [Kazachstania naganishii CBS 8797]CCK68867.1 hypothetical protein KNAG_0B04330 [Kazachstania naganishii CBS 8797]
MFWLKLYSSFLILVCVSSVCHCFENVMLQTSVPVIMYSHRLSPGLTKYQDAYDPEQKIPKESFRYICEELIDKCNSDAYIFINQPGLNRWDFEEYRHSFSHFEKYINGSSTALKFEQVGLLDDEFFKDLLSYTSKACNVREIITLEGNNTDEFQPYIDTDSRIVRIDFPRLSSEVDLREEEIQHFDSYLRTVLAQIPSPYHTVIYTSLESSEFDADLLKNPGEIFQDIFATKTQDIEINDRLRQDPIFRNSPNPRFSGMANQYISVFDSHFVKENYNLLKLIGTTFFCFVIYQVFALFRDAPVEKRTEPAKKKLSQE